MQLFFDRFGGVITILLAVLLALSTTMWIVTESKLDKRIETLEGCCDEVQQYMEAGSRNDEAKMRAYVDQKFQEMQSQQTEAVSQLVEEKTQSVKEEVSAQISEEVKTAVESSKSSSTQTKSKKKKNSSSASQASVSSQSQTSTTITTITTAETTSGGEAYDPDDQHFKVGSGDEEED